MFDLPCRLDVQARWPFPKLWHIQFFSISNFWDVRAGLENIGRSITTFINLTRGRESDLHTKFQPNRSKIAKVIPFFKFLGSRLVGPVASTDFENNFST